MLRQTIIAVLLSSPLWTHANGVKPVNTSNTKTNHKAEKVLKNTPQSKKVSKTSEKLNQTNKTQETKTDKLNKSSKIKPEQPVKAIKTDKKASQTTDKTKSAELKTPKNPKTELTTNKTNKLNKPSQPNKTKPEEPKITKTEKTNKSGKTYSKKHPAFVDKQSVYHVNFGSPSRNIVCGGDVLAKYGGAKGVSCHLKKMDTQPLLPKPKTCKHRWGKIFELPRVGKPNLACYTDTPYSDKPASLSYGDSVRGQGWLCTSLSTGMKCVNKQGRGFEINRGKQTFF